MKEGHTDKTVYHNIIRVKVVWRWKRHGKLTGGVAEMKNFGVGLRDDVASLFVHHHVLLQVDVIIVNLEICGKEEGKDGDNGGQGMGGGGKVEW